MGKIDIEITGFAPSSKIGVWPYSILGVADMKNPIFLGTPLTAPYTHTIVDYDDDILVRVRKRAYLPFFGYFKLKAPKTVIPVTMMPDVIYQGTNPPPAPPEFTLALATWLEEQGFHVGTNDNIILITGEIGSLLLSEIVEYIPFKNTPLAKITIECYIYHVSVWNHSICLATHDHRLHVEWIDPRMFDAVAKYLNAELEIHA